MTIPELLEKRASEHGNRAFVFLEEVEYSYKTLHEHACCVAANLKNRGLGLGDKIVLLTGNCMEFLYVFLGAGRIGCVVVPVNPTLTPAELSHIVNNSDATAIVMVPDLAPLLPAIHANMPNVRHVFVTGDVPIEGTQPFAQLLEPVQEIPPIVVDENSDAAIMYTSGTTGLPKGVVLTHRNYIWNARSLHNSNPQAASGRALCILPLFHVNAQVVTVLYPLFAGASVVIMSRMNVLGILPLIAKYKITFMSAVPTIYNVLCSLPKAKEYDISSIEFFVSGGAPLPEDTYVAVQRVFNKPLIMGYGLSEATCASMVATATDPIRWSSVGPVLRYTSVRIVNDEGQDVPVGDVGEILISGPCVMKGYYKNPEATAEVLKNGWLSSGDLGRMDEDGYLYIVGRVKDMIIRGGMNVYPAQIEGVLIQLQGVEEACVVGVEEPRWGQEILAVIKVVDGHTLTEDEVMEFCRQHLAPYKCPAFVRFVDHLPKTPLGKHKKNLVVAPFADIAK